VPGTAKRNLKKQSQFSPALIGAKSFIGDSYEKMPACKVRENKAKQSQFQSPTEEKGPKEFSVGNIRPDIVSRICEIGG
jgi:hypothetical protein